MVRALKVYRTPIGFHDAYVAAPSQKAALQAWNTEKNLFARGAAELVTDPELTREALSSPGEVILKARGDLSDHLVAAATPRRAKEPISTRPTEGAESAAKRPSRRMKARPSRTAVAEAEAAVAAQEARIEQEARELRVRESALRAEGERMRKRQKAEAGKLEKRLARAKDRYSAALDRWRAES